jgi:hypothetical protein
VIHWKEGHKNKCHAPKANNFGHTINKSEIMCNGKHLETPKNANPTNILNPISLGFFKNDNKKLVDAHKNSLPIQATKGPCHSLPISGGLSKPKKVSYSIY